MRKTLSDKGVMSLKPRAARYAMPDPEMIGHYIRVQPSGAKTFVAVARSPAGKQIWTAIGAADVQSIAEAREQAREIIKRVRAGLPAVETKPDSVADVAGKWFARHVEARGVRTHKEIKRLLDRHILPAWGSRELVGIKRSDVTALLDRIEDRHGARTADRVLVIFTAIANWHAARTDDYSPPVIRGQRRQSTAAQARDRILNDDEIRAVWKAAEDAGTLGSVIKLLMLTAQRRAKVAQMRWQDLDDDGTWTIPTEAREKGNAEKLLLPRVALEIIRAQPRLGPFVFPGRRGIAPFRGYNSGKAYFDAKLPAMPNWTLHDLRRTARSLMSRAGVGSDVAEKVMGHAVGGVQGTYDRHEYRDEKADALARLAGLIDGIVSPRGPNVIPMRGQQ
jgi:integrase